ncbi:hypothetical protein Pfo_025892 [Paulownia fortunei]|nr:hypothetical protein Pfo_025892 [Paulownia fortunei]
MMRVNAWCCELAALMSHFNLENSVKFGVFIVSGTTLVRKLIFCSNIQFRHSSVSTIELNMFLEETRCWTCW